MSIERDSFPRLHSSGAQCGVYLRKLTSFNSTGAVGFLQNSPLFTIHRRSSNAMTRGRKRIEVGWIASH